MQATTELLNYLKVIETYLQGLYDGFSTNNFKKELEDEMHYNGIVVTKRVDNRYQTKINNKFIYGKTPEECFENYLTYFIKKSEYSVEKWVNEWLETYKSTNRVSTLKSTKSILDNYVKEFYNKDITSIKSIDIQKQINGLQISGKLRQAQKLFCVWNDLLDKAFKNQVIEFNPCLSIKKPKYKAEEKKALSLQEEKDLLNYIKNGKFEYVIKFALYQGLRIGEVLGLKLLDIKNDKISIVRSRNSKNDVGLPKTTESTRIIPLFEKTKIMLSEFTPGKEFIFEDVKYNNIQKYLRRLQTKFNIELTSHTFRHTFATRCCEKGISMKQVSKWLGHSSIDITTKIYTHINNDFEEKQVEIINSDTDF